MGIAWSGARWRRRLARLCTWLAVASIVAAMTGPSVAVEPTGREGVLELVIDASGSMQAKDVAPTRLKATQRAALRLLDRLPPRLRVGLIGFSTTAGTQALPTTDRDALRGRIATLRASGSTAVDQALQHALEDIRMSHPAAPAWMLLISDGTSLMPGNPAVVARLAAARHVQVLAVALGRPDATVTVRDPFGDLQRVPIPPDLFTLTRIASVTGGHAVGARSEPELEAALDGLILSTGLDDAEQRDLTLLLAAGALLLLAVGRALTPARPASGPNDRRPVARRRWRQPVALLVAAGLATVTWTHWLPNGPSLAGAEAAALAKLAAQPTPAPAPPPRPPAPPFVIVTATKADRTIVQQAARLLRTHGALAPQRTTEIRQQHLTPIAELEVSACDVCVTEALTSPGDDTATTNGQKVCEVTLNTPFARQQATRARVPVRMLVAMAMLHEQELCLHTRVSYAGEQRLAKELHNPLLLDLLYAQIEAGQHDWNTVHEAVVILRDHGELAFQRHDDIKRRHLSDLRGLRDWRHHRL